jgi:hypothetical protein
MPPQFSGPASKMLTADTPPGPYNCVGRNLAFLTLRTSISRIVQNFDITFAPGETGERFDQDALETLTTTLPPVMVQFTARVR